MDPSPIILKVVAVVVAGFEGVTVCWLFPTTVTVWAGHEPESDTPVPATSDGVVVPVPPLAMDSGKEKDSCAFGNVPVYEIVPRLRLKPAPAAPPVVIVPVVVRPAAAIKFGNEVIEEFRSAKEHRLLRVPVTTSQYQLSVPP